MASLIEKVILPKHEQTAASGVKDALGAAQGPLLRTPGGAEVAIPAELAHLFERLADAAAQGLEIAVTVGDPRLRPREAAAELGMSRTHLCSLMDAGEIAYENVGTHRRVPKSEVDRYRAARAEQVADRYRAATAELPDVPDQPMTKLPRRAPRRPRTVS